MMKQYWYDIGYEAYKSGQAKLLPYEKGAKYLTKVEDSAKKRREFVILGCGAREDH